MPPISNGVVGIKPHAILIEKRTGHRSLGEPGITCKDILISQEDNPITQSCGIFLRHFREEHPDCQAAEKSVALISSLRVAVLVEIDGNFLNEVFLLGRVNRYRGQRKHTGVLREAKSHHRIIGVNAPVSAGNIPLPGLGEKSGPMVLLIQAVKAPDKVIDGHGEHQVIPVVFLNRGQNGFQGGFLEEHILRRFIHFFSAPQRKHQKQQHGCRKEPFSIQMFHTLLPRLCKQFAVLL